MPMGSPSRLSSVSEDDDPGGSRHPKYGRGISIVHDDPDFTLPDYFSSDSFFAMGA